MATNRPPTNSISNINQRKPPQAELCKFFIRGLCRFGANCFYSHAATSKPNKICQYYLAGNCSFGERCFYDHVIPKPNAISTSLGTNTNFSENSSASTSPSTSSTTSNKETSETTETTETNETHETHETNDTNETNLNKNFVTRFTEKPKLKTKLENDYDTQPADTSNEVRRKKPVGYYEALTGEQQKSFENENENFEDLVIKYYTELENVEEGEIREPCASKNVNKLLCPYYEKSLSCPFEAECEFIHGSVCDICNCACLNPSDESQCEEHRLACMQNLERDMEEAFAVQRSSEKLCGICMDTVWGKEKEADRRFGILENCNHVFCLECIRKWRASKSYENKICKACPECRVKSDFVTPNKFWFENEEDKMKIIQFYKLKLGQTACKYFKQGAGECPFGNKCFYLHQYKDGSLADLPEPTRRYRLNRNGLAEAYSNIIRIDFDFSDDENDDFDILEFFRHSLLWDTENEDNESDQSDIFELSDEFLI